MTRERVLYATCMVLALGVALVLRRPSTLPLRQRWSILAGAIGGAGIGAKLPFVLLSQAGFFTGEAWLGDGKTLLSGLAGGYLGVEISKFLAGVREKTGDGFAVPLAAALAIGRWGCVFNGCCSAPGLLIPVPVYESVFHAGMAFVLWRLQGIEILRWQLLKLYLIAYGLFRFGTEFIRSEPRLALGLTAYQVGAFALASVMALLWWRDERLKRENDHRRLVDSPAAEG